jgi:hypothetical protein
MSFEDKVPESWIKGPLKEVPVVLRDDGFTQFFVVERMTKEVLEKRCIDFLADTKVSIKEWGLGPGSVFTFDTKVGETFGSRLTQKQLDMLREGDRRVHRSVKEMIEKGHDPLEVAVNHCHELGLKIWARLEMNHEYPPPDENNWLWVGLVGEFNKKHPEYRLPNSVNLDFSIQAVRDFKLAILREAALKGVDGISMDFAVYPPFVKNPKEDYPVMTEFVAKVREMTKEIGNKENRKIALIVRVPINYEDIGLDWKTWVDQGLIDVIVPTVVRLRDIFDVPIEQFIQYTRGTGCKVFGCIRPYLGYIDSDSRPEDDKTGVVRYDRDMTDEMFYAKAFLLLRAGVDGIQLATGSGDCDPETDNWKKKTDAWKPIYSDAGSPDILVKKNKDYVFNRKGQLPLVLSKDQKITGVVNVRIADDIQELMKEKTQLRVVLVLFCRGLEEGEKLNIQVNDNSPWSLTAEHFKGKDLPIEITKEAVKEQTYFSKDWWKKGMHEIDVPSDPWILGNNRITMSLENGKNDLIVTDMDVKLFFE